MTEKKQKECKIAFLNTRSKCRCHGDTEGEKINCAGTPAAGRGGHASRARFPGTASTGPPVHICHALAYEENKWPSNKWLSLLIPLFVITDNVYFINQQKTNKERSISGLSLKISNRPNNSTY